MKGLILKDLYMMRKYCKRYLIIVAFFIAISLLETENLLFIFYPCMVCGMIPVTLLSYDEHSGWQRYSATLPYTPTQIVSGKYLISIGVQVAVLIITGAAQAIRMSLYGGFVIGEYLVLMMLLLLMSLIASSMCLPFMFKMGVEKGRITYYIMIALVCAGSVVSSKLFSFDSSAPIKPNGILPMLCLAAVAIYALSWYLSVVFYKKLEIH